MRKLRIKKFRIVAADPVTYLEVVELALPTPPLGDRPTLLISGFLAALECTKFVFNQGSAPDPIRGSLKCSPRPQTGLRGATSNGEGRGRRGKEHCQILNFCLSPCTQGNPALVY